MKNKYMIPLFAVSLFFLASCEKDYEELAYQEYRTVQFNFDFKPKYAQYRGQFGDNTFILDPQSLHTVYSSKFSLAETLFDENGYTSGNLEICPVDRHYVQTGEPIVFPITLKADTLLYFRQAVGDNIRQLLKQDDTAALDGTQYTRVYLEPVFAPEQLNYTAVIGEDAYMPDWSRKLWFNKERMRHTISFYAYNSNFPLDVEKEKPELTLEDYTFRQEEKIRYIRPLGSPMEIYKEENAGLYTTLSCKIVYGQPEGQAFSYYNGDRFSGSGKVRKDHLNGTIRMTNVTFNAGTRQYDTTLLFSESREFLPDEKIELIYLDGQAIYNEYQGADPTDRTCFFCRVKAPEYNYYDENFESQKYPGPYDIKVSLAKYDEMNGVYYDYKLLREFSNIKAGEFSEPFEIHVRGDIVPEELYDAKIVSGEPLLHYDENFETIMDEWLQCRWCIALEVYRTDTHELCFQNVNTPLDLSGIDANAFQNNETYTGLLLPPSFTYKCFYVEQTRWNISEQLKQGKWEN